MIGIIDYGMGNLRSVQKALERVGAQAAIVSRPSEAEQVAKLVLPGVGAFADGMTQLRQRGWDQAIVSHVRAGRLLLGICLGLQLLFDRSQEDAPSPDAPVAGLGLLPGQVLRFDETRGGGERLKVPHMGWNTLAWQREDPLLAGLEPGCWVYFVHSYYAVVDSDAEQVMTATSDYGGPFTASVWRENIWATQFHPEKSQAVGLRILENFAGF